MAENAFAKKTILDLLTSAGDAANGAAELQLTVPLLQNPESQIRVDIAALSLANDIYEQTKTAVADARTQVHTTFDTCLQRLVVARDNFKPLLGSQFGPPWQELAMPDSMSFPRNPVDLQPIVRAYKIFLDNHPDQEIPTKHITSAEFQALYEALEAARNTVSTKELLSDNAKATRDLKADKLRKRMRSLVDELNMLLDPLDPRWKRYGFNKPGAQETPDQVTGLKATLIGPTAAAMKWDTTARAEYFRVWKKVVGVDAEPVAVGSPADLDFTMEGLPTGSQIEIYVSAVNNGGEGPLSEKVVVTTHA